MDYKQFREWLSGSAQLGRQQRGQAEAVLSGASRRSRPPWVKIAAAPVATGRARSRAAGHSMRRPGHRFWAFTTRRNGRNTAIVLPKA